MPWRETAGHGWRDPAEVEARLAEGADVNARLTGSSTPLHEAVLNEAPVEVVETLLAHGARVDARDASGATPLWLAVRYGHRDAVEALLRAGAAPWAPVVSGWSPGRYALDGPLADLFRGLPGAPAITDAERLARQRANSLIHSYSWVGDWFVYLSDVTFVAGLTEAEATRRLGADLDRCRPARSPYHGLWDEPDPDTVEEGDEEEPPGHFDVYLGSHDGGVCLLGQGAATSAACRSLSEGTRLATVFLNEAKAICNVRCWEDGAERYSTDPVDLARNDREEEWLYRFGDAAHHSAYEARALALMSHHTGVGITEEWLLHGPMRGIVLPGP